MKKNNPKDEPKVFAVNKDGDDYKISRRTFLGAAGAATLLSSVGAGCSSKAPPKTAPPKISAFGKAAFSEDFKFKAHSNDILALCFNADNSMLASGGLDKIVKLWSIPEGRMIGSPGSHKNSILCMAFSPDNALLASAGLDKVVNLWSPVNKTLVKSLENTDAAIQSLAFSHDSSMLAAGTQSGTIYIWSLPDGDLIKTIKADADVVGHLAFHPNDFMLISAGFKTLKTWSMPEGSLKKTIDTQLKEIIDIRLNADGTRLMVIGRSNRIKTFAMPHATEVATVQTPSATLAIARFSQDQFFLASAEYAKYDIQLLSTSDPGQAKALKGHQDSIGSIAFTGDNTFMASGDLSNRIILWCLPEGKPSYILFDPNINKSDKMRKVKQMGNKTMTLPCGTPIPAGATCICDCISTARSYESNQQVCICDTILVSSTTKLSSSMVCICNTIAVGTAPPPTTTYSPGRTYYRSPGSSYRTYYYTYWYPN